MVEAGESVSVVLKKEFAEEAMNMLEQSESEKKKTQQIVDEFFKGGSEVRYFIIVLSSWTTFVSKVKLDYVT